MQHMAAMPAAAGLRTRPAAWLAIWPGSWCSAALMQGPAIAAQPNIACALHVHFCAENCKGKWHVIQACSATCDHPDGNSVEAFSVTQPATNGGKECSHLDGKTRLTKCTKQNIKGDCKRELGHKVIRAGNTTASMHCIG